MKKSVYIYGGIAAVLLVLFVLLAVLLTCVDVRSAGDSQAEVGFATLNEAVFDALGQSEAALTLSKLCGIVIIAAVGAFGVTGLVQVIRRKGILRADAELYAMLGGLVLLAAAYVLFEVVVINCRPVLDEGELAASFPSSHTMLAISAAGMGTAYLIKALKGAWRIVSCVALNAAAAATVAGRLLGGVHWLTDIVGGCLYGLFIVFCYLAACRAIESIRTRNQ